MQEMGARKRNIFKVLRSCMGISVNEMSKRSGISAIYLNELERGKKTNPSDDILKKIASACGLKVSTLKFFIEEQDGPGVDYQAHLLKSLEIYADNISKK